MGKKRCFSRFIWRWNKSDLPDERSSVLLLGVSRISTSPVQARRSFCLPVAPNNCHIPLSGYSSVRRNSFSRRHTVKRNPSKKGESRHPPVPVLNVNFIRFKKITASSSGESFDSEESPEYDLGKGTPYNSVSHENSCAVPAMYRSVDSVGTCSLDVDASADLSDCSEVSSTGTLKSVSIATSPNEPHLPSYLSLACTVNGYSTTTNYDPVRLARSRDASPNRNDLIPNRATYSIRNNLLSPPNLVPLPIPSKSKAASKKKMENTLTQRRHEEFYSSTKTINFLAKESNFTSNIFTTTEDNVDSLENGHHSVPNKCISFNTANITTISRQSKCTSETSIQQVYSNVEEKSFIQQRVERLYGPGALAQGFFVTKRQKSRLSDSDDKNTSLDSDRHSKSMSDKLLDEDESEPLVKQSTSSPTLPVLRHLRPEFRAQLPISPRKGVVENSMQKSITVPKLKKETDDNSRIPEEISLSSLALSEAVKEKLEIKDGRYFLKILDEQSKRLLDLAAVVESEISTPDLSEEVIGKLRSAAGKAKLLVSQKMQQFRGLCTNNINQVSGEAFPTTNEDLQGFWDMVMLQIDQVDELFKEIDILRNNNWKEVDKVEIKKNGAVKTPRKRISCPKTNSSVNEDARKQREAQRKKMIEERRKALKSQQNKPRQSIEIFVPELS